METKNELFSLEYYKHKCKVLQLQIDWLDELCNFERDNQYQLNDPNGEMEEWKEEIEEMELNFRKEKDQFNSTYNL